MKLFMIRKNILRLVLIAGVLTGCGDRPGSKIVTEEPDSDTIKKEVILSTESEALLSRFPTPFELTRMMNDARAPYIGSLSNSPANVTRYFTEKTKSINLGIYSADLAYASTYNRSSETEKFLYCTGKLAGDLGIAGIYDKRLVRKVNMQKSSRDSLVALIDRVFGETNDFLRRNNRIQVEVLVAAGAFVEGLYIAVSLCQVARNNIQIAAAIYKQKENLDKLLRIFNEYGMDSNLKPVTAELERLKPVFSDYGLGSGTSLPREKTAAIVDLTAQVRTTMIK